jgi:hypothetical protein
MSVTLLLIVMNRLRGKQSLPKEDVLGVLQLAHRYRMDRLKEACGVILGGRQLESGLRMSNTRCLALLKIADRYIVQSVYSACAEHVGPYFSDLWESDPRKLLALSPLFWEALVTADHLNITYVTLS